MTDSDITQLQQDSSQLLARVVEAIGGSEREGQTEMSAAIAAAIEKGENLIAQAGTGTGKSLAYLVPAVLAAKEHRVVISTATLGLQRQLIVKDIPAVLEQLPESERPEVAVLKGWNHYLCRSRLEGVYPADALFAYDEQEGASRIGKELRKLRKWDTETGDRDELPEGISDRIWRQVSLPRNRCIGRKCAFWDECFPRFARERAEQAQIVITNHALMGIAATTPSQVLGEHSVTIVDEAHALADHVRSQATLTLSPQALQVFARALSSLDEETGNKISSLATELSEVLSGLETGLQTQTPPALLDLALLLRQALRDATSALEELKKEDAAQLLKGDAQELSAIIGAATSPEPVRWIEYRGEEPQLVCAPLDVASLIGSAFAAQGRMVLTSATLSVGGEFDAIARETGLVQDGVEYRSVRVASPFSYRDRGICYIAEDLPAPRLSGMPEASAQRICELIEASGGGALVLVSSHRALEEARAYLSKHLELPFVTQGDEQLSVLIDRFISEKDLSLLGTMSLWQGIDAPGDTCRLVIIDRIPFPHPDNPMIQARNNEVKERGGNAFAEVSLPHAALLLSQGAGRLIRSNEDRGVLALLDSRLISKNYGAFLREDLPQLWPTKSFETVKDSLGRLRQSINDA